MGKRFLFALPCAQNDVRCRGRARRIAPLPESSSMKTSLLAAALAAGLAAQAGIAQAQTNVRLYGLVDAYAGYVDNSAANRGSALVVNSGGMTTSFFGMNGSEDLGGGLRAVFALESFFRVDGGQFGRFGNGPDLGFTRSAWVGMAGNFGQVTLGRNTSPFFLATVFFNPFGDSFVFSPLIAHTWLGSQLDGVGTAQSIVQGDTGFSNSLRWTSPSLGGLRADIALAARTDGIFVGENFTGNRSQGRAGDFALFFNRGPLAASVVYRNIDLDSGADPTAAGDRKQSAFQLGASYDFRVAKLFGTYQDQRENYEIGSDAKKRGWQLGASVPLTGSSAVLASFARSGFERPGVQDNTRSTLAIGYNYTLSRRTDLYANWLRDQIRGVDGAAAATSNNTQNVIGFGIRHRF
jgi:predicted porin